MKTAMKDKHLRLNQEKIEKVKKIIGAKTETEAIEKALNFLIERDTFINKRREIMRRIISRRERLGKIKGDVADWIGESRRERERMYGR
jgi:hypothetical protein